MLGQGNVDKSRDQKETCGSSEGLQNGHMTYVDISIVLKYPQITSDFSKTRAVQNVLADVTCTNTDS